MIKFNNIAGKNLYDVAYSYRGCTFGRFVVADSIETLKDSFDQGHGWKIDKITVIETDISMAIQEDSVISVSISNGCDS